MYPILRIDEDDISTLEWAEMERLGYAEKAVDKLVKLVRCPNTLGDPTVTRKEAFNRLRKAVWTMKSDCKTKNTRKEKEKHQIAEAMVSDENVVEIKAFCLAISDFCFRNRLMAKAVTPMDRRQITLLLVANN